MKRKIVTCLFAVATMMFGLVGCSGPSVAGTYKVELSTEDISGNLAHNGYLVAMQSTETNTLVLNEDGTYTYTKALETHREDYDAITLNYVFTGTYTAEDMVVTLEAPTECEFDEVWGPLTEHGFQNTAGKASAGDKVECTAESGHDPMHFFTTPYLLDSGATGEVVVTLDTENSTFEYEEAASSDDE